MKISVVILSILFSLIGVYLAVRINIEKKKIDPATLRARVFLNESFLKDSWKLLLIALILFIIRAFTELEELFETVMDNEISELLDEVIGLGILICLILLLYKWLKLMNPQKLVIQNNSRVSEK